MKKHGWLTITVILALTLVMLWAVPTLAQGRGKGQWGQGGQGWGCGQGQAQATGNNACPNYQAYQTGQGAWCTNPQAGAGTRGPRGGGRNAQPNPQTTAPQTQ
jgi:hypothetical protein